MISRGAAREAGEEHPVERSAIKRHKAPITRGEHSEGGQRSLRGQRVIVSRVKSLERSQCRGQGSSKLERLSASRRTRILTLADEREHLPHEALIIRVRHETPGGHGHGEEGRPVAHQEGVAAIAEDHTSFTVTEQNGELKSC